MMRPGQTPPSLIPQPMRAHGRQLTALALIAGVKCRWWEPDWLLRRRVKRALLRVETRHDTSQALVIGWAAEPIPLGSMVAIDGPTGRLRCARPGEEKPCGS